MYDIHQEKHFESEIVAHLVAHGWLEGEDAKYDRASALYPEDVLTWVETAYPQEWTKLQNMHGADAGARILERLTKELDSHRLPGCPPAWLQDGRPRREASGHGAVPTCLWTEPRYGRTV